MVVPFFLLLLLYSSVCCWAQATSRVLIYSFTAGFRHDSIPTAIQALKTNGSRINTIFDNTEDPAQFTDQILSQYDALLFLSTTGEVLNSTGKIAFQNYLNLGGNFVGIHSATDTLRNDSFYMREIGALFDYHANLQNATVDVIDSSHPSTSMLPAEWHVQDEMYNFDSDPRTLGATVVLAANESSYIDTGVRRFDQGTPHPLAWFQTHGAGVASGGTPGRSFYTSLGHLNETWEDPLFLSHVLGGVSWTLQSNTTRSSNSSALVGNGPNVTGTGTAMSSSTGSIEPTGGPAVGTPGTPSGAIKLSTVRASAFMAGILHFFILAL